MKLALRAHRAGLAFALGTWVLAPTARLCAQLPTRPMGDSVKATGRDNTANCDSIVATARADSTRVNVRAYLFRIDDEPLPPAYRSLLLQGITSHLTLPKPLGLPVFEPGPVRLRMLRVERNPTGDSTALRAPVLTGVYQFVLRRNGTTSPVVVAASSLVPEFDSSIVRAVAAASQARSFPPLRRDIIGNEIPLELRISSGAEDSRVRVPGYDLFASYFPRIRMIDARPSSGNLPPVYPNDERDEGSDAEVFVQMVVGTNGSFVPGTVEVIRSPSQAFTLAALRAVIGYKFTPAHVNGCFVPQLVHVPFWFSLRP
jgi:Gram-negative bacterial TonB protein C-terminal